MTCTNLIHASIQWLEQSLIDLLPFVFTIVFHPMVMVCLLLSYGLIQRHPIPISLACVCLAVLSMCSIPLIGMERRFPNGTVDQIRVSLLASPMNTPCQFL
jgi:hypothetical protein